jgi:hypothetical protein
VPYCFRFLPPSFPLVPVCSRMEESLCLSALRSQFYSVPAGGAFPHLHPSALHMQLPGARYPGEFSHTHSALAERYSNTHKYKTHTHTCTFPHMKLAERCYTHTCTRTHTVCTCTQTHISLQERHRLLTVIFLEHTPPCYHRHIMNTHQYTHQCVCVHPVVTY